MASLTISGLSTRQLNRIDLSIAAGECIALSGPSGSGKSRLLRAIADLDPSEGVVSIDRTTRDSMAAPLWRRRVGLLVADNPWWHDHVGSHFRVIDEQLLGSLGFDPEVVDWEVTRLSSGERQRLALARLLVGKPEVLLLDEPTANLDRHNSELVERVVADYRQNRQAATLWVGHDADQRRRVARRIMAIDSGHLCEEQQ